MQCAENLDQLEAQIYERFNTLSNRLQQVARYALDNRYSIAFNTIAVIAKEIQVPPSTLIRFAQTFGYKGFNNIKRIYRTDLLAETPNYHDRARLINQNIPVHKDDNRPGALLNAFAYSSSESLHALSGNINATELNKAVEMFAQAHSIFVVGFGRSFGVASYLNYSLSHLNLSTYLVDGLGGTLREQLDMMTEQDVLVAISFTPYAREAVITSEVAASKGVRQLVITDHHINPLTTQSDLSIIVKESLVKDAFRTLSATQCLVQSLCVSLIYKGLENHPLSRENK